MELLIFMVLMIFGFAVVGINEDVNNYNKQLPKPKCHENDDIHDWTYHPVTKKLTCTKCDFEAHSE